MYFEVTEQRRDLLAAVAARWPVVADTLHQSKGVLHREMQVVRRLAQDFIDQEHRDELQALFSLLDQFVARGDERLNHAIAVSFMEHLRFDGGNDGDTHWAWQAVPGELSRLYARLNTQTDPSRS
ncbi:MAG: hypothetical protein AAF465_15805 [Pseudomonadota bacterium]